MNWFASLVLGVICCEVSADKPQMIERLQRISHAFDNTSFSGAEYFEGQLISKFQTQIGSNRDTWSQVVEQFDHKAKHEIDLIVEGHSRNGVWVENGDFVREERLPSYFDGGFFFTPSELAATGAGHAFGLWGIGHSSYIDLQSPEVLKTAEVKQDEFGKHLSLRAQYVHVRCYFNGPDNQLSEIRFDFDGFLKHHTGVYGPDGMPIFEDVPDKSSARWTDFVFHGDQIREVQLYYLDQGNWKKTVKNVIEKVEPLAEPLSEQIEFVATRRPEGDRVVIDRNWAKFAMRDGQLVQLFDRAAHEVLSELAGQELQLPTDRKVPYYLEDYLRRFTSNHCGVYAGATVLTALKLPVDYDRLFDHQFISSMGGSSAADLVAFIEAHGAHAKVYSGASVELLKSVAEKGDVAILHFKQSHQANDRQHWAAFLGMTPEGESKIVDLPRPVENVSTADLLTDWDGIVVVVSRQPVGGYSVASFFSSIGFWVVAVVVVLGVAHLVISRLRRYKQVASTAALLGLILVGGLAMDLVNPNGFLRNPQAVGVVVGRYVRDQFPKIQELEIHDDVVLVDARLPEDYGRITIPGSVNLPVDFSIGELRAFMSHHANLDQPLIVYCASPKCGWADHLSSRLSALGYRNIQVYEPGIAGYFQKEKG
jgi:rhodanese-related sulfurtransferase